MIVPTHVVMGKAIYEAIVATLPVSINRRWFIYGNIYPDISHYCFTMPHYPEKSMDFVKRVMNSMTRADISPTGQLDAIYSMQLGMLCHYLCDYFCHVHSSAFKGSMVRHFAYEFHQNAILMRHPFMISKKKVVRNFVPRDLPGDIETVFARLDEAQRDYLSRQHHPGEDIVLAVRNATLFASSILKLCLENAQQRALISQPVMA